MIIRSYKVFRQAFAPSGAPLDGHDGLLAWDRTLVDSGGFSGRVELDVGDGISFLLRASVDGFAASDAVPGVDDHDWFVSQRTPDEDNQPFVITRPNGYGSGTISIELSAFMAGRFPAPFEEEFVVEVFRHLLLYARRRSDGSIRWIKVLPFLLDMLDLAPVDDP